MVVGSFRGGQGLISSGRPEVERLLGGRERQVWEHVSAAPMKSLWKLHGVTVRTVIHRTWSAVTEDRLLGNAAELAFYFLFALFPTLFCASSALGLAARSAVEIYTRLLDYLALVIPTSALGTVVSTFNETTAAATSGKVTFGLIAAIWSASVGISAIQDTLNAVYKVVDSRSYFLARIYAIGLTILLTCIVTLGLASLLASDYIVRMIDKIVQERALQLIAALSAHVAGWIVAAGCVALSFAVVYYWAPGCKTRRWHWLTPGALVGMLGWVVASVGFRVYLHFFDSYSVTYGSLGAVIILLMWFYITGLMILVGAAINSEIEAAVADKLLSEQSPAA